MATCSVATLISQACENNFVAASNNVELWRAIKHQLLCNIQAAGGVGGGGSPYTFETFTDESAPFSYTATARATVEINTQLEINGSGDIAGFNVARTGVPAMQIAVNATVADFIGNYRSVSSFKLSPGDTITITDISAGAGQALLSQIVVYSE